MDSTEFIYVCTPNFRKYLFLSLRSLFASGTQIESVTIYVTADGAHGWPKLDSRVSVKRVPDISTDGYWGTNKAHLCASEADRVVFLDTDTFVREPIQQLWQGRDEDLLARLGVETYTRHFNPDKWQQAFATLDANPYPQYSPGFMVFQNGSHRRLQQTWPEVIRKIMDNEVPSIPPNRFAELYAFSLAASMEHLTHAAMPERGHRYAMLGESPDDAVVHHLGTPQFYRHYLPLEQKMGLKTRQDIMVPRPRSTAFDAIYTRIHHRLKRKFKGSRDASLEY